MKARAPNARRAILWLLIALLAVLAAPKPARALCLGVMSVSATALNFGNYDPLSVTPKDMTSTVTVSCTLILGIGILPAFTLALGTGSGTFATRTLLNGTPKLNYNLYTDFARSVVWGDGNSGTVTQSYAALLNLGTTSFTAYGRIFTGQDRPTGTYSDSITVEVDF